MTKKLTKTELQLRMWAIEMAIKYTHLPNQSPDNHDIWIEKLKYNAERIENIVKSEWEKSTNPE